MKTDAGKRVLSLLVLLCFVIVTMAQSPDKRSWKQRLNRQKESEMVCGAASLYKELGLKEQDNRVICTTSGEPLTLVEVNERLTQRTTQLITSSSSNSSVARKKEQLAYVTSLQKVVRSVIFCRAGEVTTTNLLLATAATEQLRIIEAWCADCKSMDEEGRLHYQLLQQVATSL